MKKKLLILISMLAMMFSLTACSNEVEKPFDYDDSAIVRDTMYAFEEYRNVNDEFADYYINNGTEFEQSAVKGIKQAQDTDKVGAFEDFTPYIEGNKAVSKDDYKIENASDSVSVTVINKAKNRNVEITVKYVENPEYFMELDQVMQKYTLAETEKIILQDYDSLAQFYDETGISSVEEARQILVSNEMYNKAIASYLPEEMVVSAVYSKTELMKQAGMNTLLGMGTVFVVLIFISFIISLFKFLPALFAKKPKIEDLKKEESKPAAPAKAATPAPAAGNLMNDAELVAVITAAIYAAEGQAGNGAVSKDKLVVRSIRRARK
ncbi:OadG family protein [Eubacterium sp. MSJ-33]|uniref:OadG family protein n=1 Tax=Eubacterium sp. MSJ-33 TaxID=2841528 RepID=UPI001EE2877F|nr:OadG family protein [Eubacterium sp. MSJ-33]